MARVSKLDRTSNFTRLSSSNIIDNVTDPPHAPQRRKRRGAMSSPTVRRTTSNRKEARHDPITRKGRSAFRREENTTTPESGGRLVQGDKTPGVAQAEARNLIEKARRTSGETSQIAEKASAARRDPEVAAPNDEEVVMDIDSSSSEEEDSPEDKENQRPAANHYFGPNHAANGMTIFEDTPEAENLGPRKPLGELPVPRPPQDDPNSSSETNDSGSGYVIFAKDQRRAAFGRPSLVRSPLSQPPLVQSTATEQELSIPHAPAPAPASAAATSPSLAPHTPSLGMRIRCYPLSRGPPLEGSDVTIPLPGTESSPSIVVHPPSDEEDSSPDWSPTYISRVKPREEPYQRRGRSASLSPRTDRKGRYRKGDKSGRGKGKEHQGEKNTSEVALG
ncbi:MAG: hypothetical protein Q9208_003913 [Pyrenodesmia sp. 3 TL-2023]